MDDGQGDPRFGQVANAGIPSVPWTSVCAPPIGALSRLRAEPIKRSA